MKITKNFEIKVVERHKDGGRIVINTASVDRDRDRVLPTGAKIDEYLKNPVVMFGHNYRDAWSTVGRTTKLEVSPEGIVADFELRPAANEFDPQNIVRLLWEGDWIRMASIGFMPSKGKPNEIGGTDYSEWGLLEWSIVPIGSNQDALRLAMKALDGGNELVAGELLDSGNPWEVAVIDTITRPDIGDARRAETLAQLKDWRAFFKAPPETTSTTTALNGTSTIVVPAGDASTVWVKSTGGGSNWGEDIDDPITKRGRVLSKKNEEKIRVSRDNLDDVLAQLDSAPEVDEPKSDKGYKAADVFEVGDRVAVKGRPHMAGHKAGTVKLLADSQAYGVQMDGMDEIHKWYVGSELQPEKDDKKSGEPTLDASSERDLTDALRTLTDLLKGVYQNE